MALDWKKGSEALMKNLHVFNFIINGSVKLACNCRKPSLWGRDYHNEKKFLQSLALCVALEAVMRSDGRVIGDWGGGCDVEMVLKRRGMKRGKLNLHMVLNHSYVTKNTSHKNYANM